MTKVNFYKNARWLKCLLVFLAFSAPGKAQVNWGMSRVGNTNTPSGEATQRINNTAKQTVAATPPMGWNSWNNFGLEITEDEFRQQVDYVAKYLKPYGYEYVIIDAAWYSSHVSAVKQSRYHHAKYADHDASIDAYGRLIPAPNKFPGANGSLKYLADYVHAKGLKLGIHVQRGIPWQAVEKDLPVLGSDLKAKDIANPADLCLWYNAMYGVDMSKPGGQEYYNSIMDLYASWEIDFLKIDDLVMPYHADEVTAIRKAIERTERKMVFSGSPGSTPVSARYHVLNNTDMFRVSSDFWDTWPQLKKQFEYAKQWAVYTVHFPGHWADLDMLPVGKIGTRSGDAGGERFTRFTREEQYTLMTLWCISRSPLIVSNDLLQNDDFTLKLITNKEVLAINQQGSKQYQFYDAENIAAWYSQHAKDGSHYIAIFNQAEAAAQVKVPLPAEMKDRFAIRDLWKQKEAGTVKDSISVQVPAHGVVLYQLKQN
jgi:alpha-galactosidase